MGINKVVKKSVEIVASVTDVWDALVNPEKVKKYFFGTELICDWQVGSDIIFQGEYEGHKYKDSGKIVAIEPNKILKYTYWSSFSGLENIEENYSMVTYKLEKVAGNIILSVTQENFQKEEQYEHSDANWSTVLEMIRKFIED